MSIQVYVFIDTQNPGPRRVCQAVRKLRGVVRADALFGVPDVIAIVEGSDLSDVDAVIDRIVEIDGVIDSETHVARPIADA